MELIEQELGTDIHVKGYRLLLKAVVLPNVTAGGIHLPDSLRSRNQRDYNIGLVLKMGDQAYKPLDKFGGAPFCKIGDWVHYSAYERQEEYINDHLCYYINDERVYAVIPDISFVVREMRMAPIKELGVN